MLLWIYGSGVLMGIAIGIAVCVWIESVAAPEPARKLTGRNNGQTLTSSTDTRWNQYDSTYAP